MASCKQFADMPVRFLVINACEAFIFIFKKNDVCQFCDVCWVKVPPQHLSQNDDRF